MLGFGKKDEKILAPEQLKEARQQHSNETCALIETGNKTPENTEAALAHGVHHLINHDKDIIKLMSELSPRKRAAAANCIMQAQFFDDDVVGNFMQEYFRVGVSMNRKGRGEIVHVVSTVKQEQTKQNVLARIRGFVSGQP
jgi:hypothetical protein